MEIFVVMKERWGSCLSGDVLLNNRSGLSDGYLKYVLMTVV